MAKPHKDRTSFASASSTYFVTASTWGHRSLFQTEPMARLFLDTITHYQDGGKYSLHAFVLMPDHFHMLLTPWQGFTLERVMQFIKDGFSHRVGKELGLKMKIWERGYSGHRIRDMADFTNHVGYIREKTVKTGLAGAPADCIYCSAHPGFDLDPTPQEPQSSSSGVAAQLKLCPALLEEGQRFSTPPLHPASCHNGMRGRRRWS
jgi:putative transposase